MKYTVSFPGYSWEHLLSTIFFVPGSEGAAYVLCGTSKHRDETRYLAREVLPVREEDYKYRARTGMSIVSDSYARIAKLAVQRQAAILFVHSHPDGFAEFSEQDDKEDPLLHRFFADYANHSDHGSLVISRGGILGGCAQEPAPERVTGRVWAHGSWTRISRVRVLKDIFRIYDDITDSTSIHPTADRHVRAFGSDAQKLLQRVHVGIVGVGGTGSAVAEQLTRLGVGRLSLFDGDTLDVTNVNRVYGATVADEGTNKALLAKAKLESIGTGTKISAFPEHITTERIAKELTACDLLFGCTDTQISRAILVRVSVRYLIPLFDMGVLVDSDAGRIRDVVGRVTTLFPGSACLFCRRRVTAEALRNETLPPAERAALVKEGYVPDLAETAPAVITFTTATAAQAVSELLARLTGFANAETQPTEVLLRFDAREISTNSMPADRGCQCGPEFRGRGDESPFLNRQW